LNASAFALRTAKHFAEKTSVETWPNWLSIMSVINDKASENTPFANEAGDE